MKPFPSYLETFASEKFKEVNRKLKEGLSDCTLCPRNCHVNRLEDERGTCDTGKLAMVSSYSPHFGEESCLVGTHGSGTIFFTNCNLLCTFCQNFEISHLGRGREVSPDELAAIILNLQDRGCHNINFVSPSHVIPQLVDATNIACRKGLSIPLVYNSGGYDSVEAIKLLDGIIDIYMPDMKFSRTNIAEETCGAPDYFLHAKNAIKEMHRQVGDLQINAEGIATRGLLIRHLVMPADLAGTEDIMEFLAGLSKDCFVNIMDQYYPCGRIEPGSGLGRSITRQEYLQAIELARKKGLYRFD